MPKLTKDDKIIFIEGIAALFFSALVFVLFSLLATNTRVEEIKEAFNNSEIIICHESLILSNVSWKLIDDNLINNNIAGHLDIKNCVKGL